MKKFAEHVLSVAYQSSIDVTNLQLQKVMYFVLGDYMSCYGINELAKEIYTSRFEAWNLGPVSRSVYRDYKNGELTEKYNSEWVAFDQLIEKYLRKDVYDLVDDSHSEETHWWENKEAIMQRQDRIYYELEDILSDYQKISR